MSLNGIDISSHQTGIDLAKVPCDFVICKATEGVGYVNPDCGRAYAQGQKLGKKLGVYHFATGKSSGAKEAGFFLQNIRGMWERRSWRWTGREMRWKKASAMHWNFWKRSLEKPVSDL